MEDLFRRAFGGGGNRGEARDIVRGAAKQLRSEAARCGLDAKTQRGIEAKSVTEINFVNSSDDHESIVGWAFQPNNEKSIQPYPSPEFLNSLSFIKKFYPLPFGAREKFTKGTHEIAAISRHSEAHSQSAEWLQKTRRSAGLFCNYLARLTRMRILQAKESSFLQYKAVAKNENNSTETDHASMPLGIFASKSVSHMTNVGGVGTPPYVAKNLAASLPSRLAAKKAAFTLAEGATHVAHCDKYRRVAFTLAEILITLGIIGVVAALTLPTLIQNNQKKQFQVGLQKGYSELLQALDAYKNDNGEPLTTKTCYGDTPGIFKNLIKPYLKVLVDCGDSQAVEIYDKCVQNGEYSKEGKYTYKTYSGKTAEERCFDDGQLVLTNGSILMFENPASYGRSVNVFVSIDVNGFKKGPNQWGVDLFTFQLMEDGKLLPMGQVGTYYEFTDDNSLLCDKTSGNKRNGIACTARALYDKDFWK